MYEEMGHCMPFERECKMFNISGGPFVLTFKNVHAI